MRRPLISRDARPTFLLLSITLLHSSSSFSTVPSNLPRPAPLISTPLSATASSDTAPSSALTNFYTNLNALYDNTQLTIKCPFIRRRVADALDATAMLLQFLLIRHKSLGLSDIEVYTMPGCKPTGRHIKTSQKNLNLPIRSIKDRIVSDWNGNASEGKGYYITGRLDTTIYRDDCLFTGPDPDMPVRGLRKYLSAAAQLFDSKHSHAIAHDVSYEENGGDKSHGVVTVHWELGGMINLPWHPEVDPWTGWTKYHVDEEGLIYLHEEGWDVEVWRIFLGVVFPKVRWTDVIF